MTVSKTTPAAFATRALHVGSEASQNAASAVIPSIELSTTYSQSAPGIPNKGFEYSRSSNPTRLSLERLLASLEGADALLEQNLRNEARLDSWTGGPAALAMASGSAATGTVVTALTGNAGHIVSVGDVYGGTSRFMLNVAGPYQSVATTFIDMSYRGSSPTSSESPAEKQTRLALQDEEIIQKVKAAIRPGETKAIWAETPTNPTLNLVPIRLLASLAHSLDIPLVIDNTFANPYYSNPLALGASVVVHSLTKYINGHSDVVGGAIISHHPALLEKFRFLQNAGGAVPSPFDSWLVIRGIKTLHLRSRQHGLNALKIANWLEKVGIPSGLVRAVRYPGLKRAEETTGQERERELAWEQLSVHAKKWVVSQGYSRDGEEGFPSGGMVSFYVKSSSEASQDDSGAAERFLSALGVFALAESLGGVESLAELPLKMTHAGVSIERRRELGIDGELIRLSVGVEDADDLLHDVERALRVALDK